MQLDKDQLIECINEIKWENKVGEKMIDKIRGDQLREEDMREESDTADGHRSNNGGGNGSIGEA